VFLFYLAVGSFSEKEQKRNTPHRKNKKDEQRSRLLRSM
jgi:hypothetical protein